MSYILKVNMYLYLILLTYLNGVVTDAVYFSEDVTVSSVQDIGETKKVFVFDDIFSQANSYAIQAYMGTAERYHISTIPKLSLKAHHDADLIKITRFGQLLSKAVSITNKKPNEKLVMSSLYSTVVSRGEERTLISSQANHTTVVVFISPIWKKNSYGELVLYSSSGTEEMARVQPRFGRVVVVPPFDGDLVVRPPSFSQNQDGKFVVATFEDEKNVDVYKEAMIDETVELDKWIKNHTKNPRTFEEYQGNVYKVVENEMGKKMTVVDGVFDYDEIISLRSFVLNNHAPMYYDNSLDSDSDNVQWITGINAYEFVRTNMWKSVLKATNKHFGVSRKGEWYPYDVGVNIIRENDHTRVHLDTSFDGDDTVTFLLYLSPNWTAHNRGETVFWERWLHEDDDVNEIVAAVLPLFGRAVIFDGDFPHSATPPSNGGLRMTLAVKMVPGKSEAVRMNFREDSKLEFELNGFVRNMRLNSSKYAELLDMEEISSYIERKNTELSLTHQYKLENDLKLDSCTAHEPIEYIEDDNDVDELQEYFRGENDDNFNDDISYNSKRFFRNVKRSCHGDGDCENEYLKLFNHQQVLRRKKSVNLLLSLL